MPSNTSSLTLQPHTDKASSSTDTIKEKLPLSPSTSRHSTEGDSLKKIPSSKDLDTIVNKDEIPKFLKNDVTIEGKRTAKSSSTPRRHKKKKLCAFEDCKEVAKKVIGDCEFCEGVFCSKHRLLESHNCVGLKSCKEEMRQRNAEKLEEERTKTRKISI